MLKVQCTWEVAVDAYFSTGRSVRRAGKFITPHRPVPRFREVHSSHPVKKVDYDWKRDIQMERAVKAAVEVFAKYRKKYEELM